MKSRFLWTTLSIATMISILTSCTTTTVENRQSASIEPKVKIGLFLDDGCRGNGPYQWVRLLANSPQLDLTLLDGQAIRDGKLADLQVLLCPGGGGAKQIAAMKPEGFERVRKFVEDGGSYIGICAGSYNAMNRDGRFAFLPYDYIDNAYGKLADLAFDFNEEGAKLLGLTPRQRVARYNGGNIMRPTKPTGKGDCQIVAVYKSSVSNYNKVAYNFMDTPAAVFGHYGKGKVMVTSFHPESYESTHDIALGCIYAVTGVKPVPVYPRKNKHPLRVGFCSLACVGTRAATELMALDREPDIDVDIFTLHEIDEGRLRHYDVVVMTDGDESSYSKWFGKEFYQRKFLDYLERGGRIVASGNGGKYLPEHRNVQVLSIGEPFAQAVRK
ncbi:MAG: hypothetical protein J6X55_09250 [Victivallales bacterium]|nr:hypothetical protein [Victivallales bacterium]